jgi:hypothetical protein
MSSRQRCQSRWVGAHQQPTTSCSLCGQVAVFHWRFAYPDLLLCADCLESYPETLPTLQAERSVAHGGQLP